MTENCLRLGGIVTYTSVGEWTDLAKFAWLLEEAGFKAFIPDSRTHSACLKEALQELFPDSAYMVRALDKQDGFAVVEERRGKQENYYHTTLAAYLDPPGSMNIKMNPWDPNQSELLCEKFARQLGLLRPTQVTATMVKIIMSLGGTRLRPSGAVYWLPDTMVPQWEKASRACIESGYGKPNNVYLIRHQLDADAVRAVKDAITEEMMGASVRLADEIQGGELGERALNARSKECKELMRKIENYEDILNVGMGSLRESLDKVANAAAAAAMLVASEKAGVA